MYREILIEEIKLDKALGYEYFIDKKHPLGSKGIGRVYYHRHIASIALGRWLTDKEVVHHKDGNRSNNVEQNLEVLSNSEHTGLHAGEPKVTIICQVCNKRFIVFACELHKRRTCSKECRIAKSIKWSVSKEELEALIWNIPYTKIAKQFPISDVGAKKRAISLGCRMPPAYFFSKSEEYRKEQRAINNIPDLSTQQSSKL